MSIPTSPEVDNMVGMMQGLALATMPSHFGQVKPGVVGPSSTQMKKTSGGKAPTRKVVTKAGRDTPYTRYPPVKPVSTAQEGARG
jgi:hypothetical protein